jgi:hypothetical protein
MNHSSNVLKFPLERARIPERFDDEAADIRAAIRLLLPHRDQADVAVALDCLEDRVQQLVDGRPMNREWQNVGGAGRPGYAIGIVGIIHLVLLVSLYACGRDSGRAPSVTAPTPTAAPTAEPTKKPKKQGKE